MQKSAKNQVVLSNIVTDPRGYMLTNLKKWRKGYIYLIGGKLITTEIQGGCHVALTGIFYERLGGQTVN